MSEIERGWDDRPAIIYGLGFWNRKSMRGMLSTTPGEVRFYSSFDRALKAAEKSKGRLFAWTTRLSDEQRNRCSSQNIPLVNIEDGFIRSVGLGAAFVPAASLILDGRGIYYDPTKPSDLEWMIEHDEICEADRSRAASLREKLIALRVSKYNLGGVDAAKVPETSRRKILVPGQVADDASILKTASDSLDLKSGRNPNLLLLQKVRQENPDAFIIFKPHPDVTSGLRKGALSESEMRQYADMIEFKTDIIDLIEQCDRVETICSLSGFEALLREKEVVVHGQPFYAGWGLSIDRTAIARRTRTIDLDSLVYFTLIKYPFYVNPVKFHSVDAETVIRMLSEIRQEQVSPLKKGVMLGVAKLAFRFGL
nr:beta-3-deoxy-D-manno-oct-2-ulosonic acid transferase [uncultured Cohaesibacter sp.]